MDLNVTGPLRRAQAVVPSMTQRGGGTIINGLSAGRFLKMGGRRSGWWTLTLASAGTKSRWVREPRVPPDRNS
jgi:hypothetical protein